RTIGLDPCSSSDRLFATGQVPRHDPRYIITDAWPSAGRIPIMAFRMHRVQVWSCEIPDRPGAAAAKLELLARAGANLEFVFTRPHPKKPETSIIFLAPISGAEQVQA